MSLERHPYHHGDLPAALLRAAEEEIKEKGVEGFTLRGCAKRAGVSHAAPAHHFKDANGLLTALAADGFRRLLETQQATKEARGASDKMELLIAGGLGYVDFALANPALYRLMFSSERKRNDDPELAKWGGAAFQQLVDDIEAARGRSSDRQPDEDVLAAWAIAHGLSDLMISGRIDLSTLGEAERREFLGSVLLRAIKPQV